MALNRKAEPISGEFPRYWVMPNITPGDVSPLVILGITMLVAAVGGVVPFSPIEPVLLGVAALARPSLLLPAVVLATACQMASKTLLFAGSRKARHAMSPRRRRLLDRVSARLAGRPGLQIATVLVSACAGFPPFYLVTVLCGAIGLKLRYYLIAGTIGRAIRRYRPRAALPARPSRVASWR